MNSHGFVNGSSVTVKINGITAGGILSAVCKKEKNLFKIEEFLTSKPVYSAESPVYTLELKSRVDISELLDGEPLEMVEFTGGGRKVKYTVCSLESVETVTLPDKRTEYRAVISAADRSVENER